MWDFQCPSERKIPFISGGRDREPGHKSFGFGCEAVEKMGRRERRPAVQCDAARTTVDAVILIWKLLLERDSTPRFHVLAKVEKRQSQHKGAVREVKHQDEHICGAT